MVVRSLFLDSRGPPVMFSALSNAEIAWWDVAAVRPFAF